MTRNYDSFDNLETSMRKTSVIQERIGLVSTHMYKQYLEYEQAMLNTNEIFCKIIENAQMTVEYLKQTLSSRGISTQNINMSVDKDNSLFILNILWHTITFSAKSTGKPQALYRESETPLFTGRIMAMTGSYYDIVKKSDDSPMQALLENEVSSLFIPADKNNAAIIKIKHLGNREFYINQIDAPREFLLKVIETVCGGGLCHEENYKRV